MKRFSFLIYFIFSVYLCSIAQTDQQRINDLDYMAAGGQKQMMGKGVPPAEVIGSTYFSDQWFIGDVVFYPGQRLEDRSLRLELSKRILEVDDNGRIVIYDEQDIKEFTWKNPTTGRTDRFINCRGFSIEETELTGFLHVIVEGKTSLVSQTLISIKEPDYIKGVDAGSRDYKVRKNETYYFLLDDSSLVELSGSRKKILNKLHSIYPDLKGYIKTNRLSFRNENDLRHMVNYLNTNESIN